MVFVIELILGHLLKVEVERRDYVLALNRLDCLERAHRATTAVNNDQAHAVLTAQNLVVHGFDPALPDDVSHLVVLILWKLKLLGADLADVAEHVTGELSILVYTLRLRLDRYLGVFKLMRENPCAVCGRSVLLHQYGL